MRPPAARRSLSAAVLLVLCGLMVALPQRVAAEASAMGQSVLPDHALAAGVLTGELSTEIRSELVDAEGLDGVDQALRLTVREGKQPWSMGLAVKTSVPVHQGDVMLATFQMRNVKSMTGQALVMFSFQKGTPDWDKSIWKQIGAGSEWTRVSLPFVMKDSYAAGDATAGFQLALDDQTIEIADLRVLNLGPDADFDELPNTDVAYDGREPDAPWRKVAAERIEKHRKGDLTVTVLDADGEPVPDAQVTVEMTRHAFPFGTAIAVQQLLRDDADGKRYRQEILNNFNAGGFESAMKWPFYDKEGTEFSREAIAEALDWLTEHDIPIRGHVLMWPSWRWVHPDALALKDDPPMLRQAIEDWVTTMTRTYRDSVQEWDVVNEAYSNNDVLNLFGQEIMVDWFVLAHEANPEAALYINDNEMVTAGGRVTKHLTEYKNQIRMLLDSGAPLHGIGVQGHFSASLSSPEQVWNTLDQFAEFDLPIKVTEFDINDGDPQLQADFLRDFYTAAFAHESVAGIQMWGFWEGRHWRPDAALFDRQWNLRPHGKAYRDLVFNQWWTVEEGATDDDGKFKARGFLGEYRVSVTRPGQERQEAELILDRDGASVVVTLP